ncbi:MAG TPA: selenocysteine-specific translation elongation factor [Pyrinomonadaceae bacterium]|nr:selenocysteine-specific translation elongation factor [Pyrinomonadaceae bacterium]
MHLIVGTAGHIDHGKTTLIKALTGTDTDRLPEEKKRGITIDLGFAELELGDLRIGFVDVPGHERFVKNMLAGASGIDLVLLIVAADEGVMPQTREHFDICRLLGVEKGLVVITKKDLVDAEMLDLVRLDVAELVEGSFLADAPVIAVSSTTGEGLEKLREAMTTLANSAGARRNDQVTRFPIDRSFVIKGFGTVVTGTLASGEIREGVELELLPMRRKVRVRGLQTHGKQTQAAAAGQRVAVNLAGVDKTEVARGMTLCAPATISPTQAFDAFVEVLKDVPRPLRSRQRVRVHIGTAEALARVHVIDEKAEILPGASGYVQLRLEVPVTAVMGEHFIIRSYSPQTTIAGGSVIDPLPARHRARDLVKARRFLETLESVREDRMSIVRTLVEAAGKSGSGLSSIQARTGFSSGILRAEIAALKAQGSIIELTGTFLSSDAFRGLKAAVIKAVVEHHEIEPHSRGISRETIKDKVFTRLPPEVLKGVIGPLEAEGLIVNENDIVRSSAHSRELSGDEAVFVERIISALRAAMVAPPKVEEVLAKAGIGLKVTPAHAQKLLTVCANGGKIVRVSSEFAFSRDSIDALITQLRERAPQLPNRLIDVPAFKELAGVSRKYAIPLLEYFDRVGITKRAGDKRIIV